MKTLIFLALLGLISAQPRRSEDRNWCKSHPWNGDGYCDDWLNVKACNYDGGDCCGANVKKDYCNVCQCLSGTTTTKATTAKATTTTTKSTATTTTTTTTGCSTKIPSWMKTNMTATSGFDRIIQGQKAPKPIPWQAHMREGSPTGQYSFFCGGTILDSTTILTAAHCYHGSTTALSKNFIAAGATHVQDSSAQTAFVKSITLHPNWNSNTANNDVAIIKLKTALTFNDKVQPACLPAATLNPSGKIAVASGWGLVGQKPNKETLDLMYVAKPLLTKAQCIANTQWTSASITDKMICAGDQDGGQSTCNGDSGGPLVIAGANDIATIVGTTSFGSQNGCGAKGWPAVYAYTVPFLDWIKSKMG